jgi:sugar phosphate permease
MFIGNLGGLLSAEPLAWAAERGAWRGVFVGAGVLSLLLAVFTWLFLRDNPRELGLPSMQQLEGKPEYPPARENWRAALKTVLANHRTWPGFMIMFGQVGSYLSWGGLWAIPYMREAHGMERQLAAWHVSLMILCFALSAFAVGALSDRIGRRVPLMRVLGCIYVLCWLPWLWGAPLPLTASLGLFALTGASMGGIALVWPSAKEVNPPAFSGMSTSVVNTGGFLGPALLQPLVGLALDLSSKGAAHTENDWRLGLAVLFAFALFGWLSTFWITETRCRNIYQEPT